MFDYVENENKSRGMENHFQLNCILVLQKFSSGQNLLGGV